MENVNKYPRVLIIYHSVLNTVDQHGVSLREWFAEWPKDNLAQIYSGGETGNSRFCGYNFKLGQNERRFGRFFFKLKQSPIGQSSYTIHLNDDFKKIKRFDFSSLLKNKISEGLIRTGLWELIFKPKLSKELINFVLEFKPHLIYCQGYNLSFTWLPVLIQNELQIPICFQTGDDWPTYLYKDSAFSFAIKPIVDRATKSLLSKSSARLANGESMSKEYLERYQLPFEPLMMCDNLERFRSAEPRSVVDNDTISIVYSGNLGQGRWVSLIDLCEAAKLIPIQDHKIMITAFATTIPQEAINKLHEIENLQIFPGPSHEELPSYLKAADILYLPETFDPIKAREIRLSISTKAHFYMMSEKPVLVYGSAATGIVNYALKEGWACVVQEQSLKLLAQALYQLLTNKEYCNELVRKGLKVASVNHNDEKIKTRFLNILSQLKINL